MRRGSGQPETETRPSVSGMHLSEEAVSASRSVPLAEVPARWLDRLLVATADLPVEAGEEAVTLALLEALLGTLPGNGFGARITIEGQPCELRVLGTSGEPERPVVGSNASGRLFPGFLYERTFPIPDAGDDALHIASDDPGLQEETFLAAQLVHRACFLLRPARQHARAYSALVQTRQVVTDRTAQLVQAEKLASLGQMAASIAHELNNPLTSIVAYTDYLLKVAGGRGDQDEIERLKRIAESAHRVLVFARDLVTYSRPAEGPPQPVVVSALLDQALLFCEHVLAESGVTVERDFGDGVLPVRGVPSQLAQIFVNLITNACHAMPERGGCLVVRTELAMGDSVVRVTVTDNGHGIAKEHLDRLFEPFFTTKGEGKGSGLGLSIVKDIADSHRADISVRSEPGQGTTFIIDFPVATISDE